MSQVELTRWKMLHRRRKDPNQLELPIDEPDFNEINVNEKFEELRISFYEMKGEHKKLLNSISSLVDNSISSEPVRHKIEPTDKPELVSHSSPPTSYLLSLILPTATSEDLIENLHDLFPLWEKRHGIRMAKWIFRWQVAGVIMHYFLKPIKKLLIEPPRVYRRLQR